MLTLQFLVPVIFGVVLLWIARLISVQGQRRRSLALQWLSLATVAFALLCGFEAVEQLANFLLSDLPFTLPAVAWPLLSDLWLALQLAAEFLALCALVVAGVYGVWEQLRGSGTQR